MSCYDGDDIDSAALLSVMQLRNPSGWFSLEGRALDQARRLHEFAREANARADADPSYPGLRIVKTLGDLRDVVESRKGPRYLIGAVLSLEGVHWLGDPGLTDTAIAAGVRRLYDAGFRVLALTHQFDNGLADASEGCRFAGERAVPTEAGRVVIREAERLGMIIDLAHAASRTIKGVLAVARNPVVVSHTGVRETCPVAEGCSPRRNIADDDIRGIAQRGGVIGIGYWTEAVGAGIAGIVRAQRHVIDVLGPAEACRHLAFGSDFDGSVSMPFDAVALPELTAAMRRSFSSAPGPGCGDSRGLRLIAGANVCRIFAMRLPLGSLAEADRSTICASLEN
jgi:membrane dipeptidase